MLSHSLNVPILFEFLSVQNHTHMLSLPPITSSLYDRKKKKKKTKSLTNDGRAEPLRKVHISLWIELWKNENEISLTSEPPANRAEPHLLDMAPLFRGGCLAACYQF